MDDSFGLVLLENRFHCRSVSNIFANFSETLLTGQPFEARLFEVYIVIVIDVVDADDLVTTIQQPMGQM
jgi:hypothetical protein